MDIRGRTEHVLQKRNEALNDCCDVQRRGGRSSGDVQVLRLDDDGQGSRTEYMKVRQLLAQAIVIDSFLSLIQHDCSTVGRTLKGFQRSFAQLSNRILEFLQTCCTTFSI